MVMEAFGMSSSDQVTNCSASMPPRIPDCMKYHLSMMVMQKQRPQPQTSENKQTNNYKRDLEVTVEAKPRLRFALRVFFSVRRIDLSVRLSCMFATSV